MAHGLTWRGPDVRGADANGVGPAVLCLRVAGRSPVLVTLEYRVNRDQSQEFLEAIHEYGRVRRRDGAYRWGVYRDLEDADRYVETFLIRSWAEHLRQHERSTKADREVEDRLRTYVTGVPKVRHLVAAESDR